MTSEPSGAPVNPSGPGHQAVLFDMDGTLVDSAHLWQIALHELAAELGGSNLLGAAGIPGRCADRGCVVLTVPIDLTIAPGPPHGPHQVDQRHRRRTRAVGLEPTDDLISACPRSLMKGTAMNSPLTVGFGADDAGADLKNLLLAEVTGWPGIATRDFGVADSESHRPYPEIGLSVATAVAAGHLDRALLVCGTGIGMAISANKVAGVRATVATDAYSVERSVLSNNCQVLALGARILAPQLALTIVRQWLDLRFDEKSGSASKLALLAAYETSHA